MGSTNSLKHRFEKLQKTSVSTVDIVLDTETPPEQKKMELQASLHPQVHEKVRQASPQPYDWKKQYKQLFQRPNLTSSRSKFMIEFEGNIQGLADRALIVSFTQNPQLDMALSKTMAHMASRRGFWKTILKNVQNLHVACEKNKIHFSVNYECYSQELKADLKKFLEKEYLSENNSIKTYHLAGNDEWVDIILELTPVNDGRRAEEATI